MNSWKVPFVFFLSLLIILVGSSCSSETAAPAIKADVEISNQMQITSTAFEDGGTIPTTYTCDADDRSPPLAWNDIPEGTQSLVLIVDDQDAPAGTWVHWLLYDIPPCVDNLPEGQPPTETVPGIGTQGSNDFGRIGYGGPCPPGGSPHHYYFKLYALDMLFNLEPGMNVDDLETVMSGHILDQVELMGIYVR